MRKLISAALAAALLCMILSGCGDAAVTTASTGTADSAAAAPLSSSGSADAEGVISLSDSGCSAGCAGVSISGSTVTISAAGSYELTGSLSDGQIVVNAGDSDKVELWLNGVSISCSGGAAIYAENADKLIIATSDGTVNTLASTGDFAQTDGVAVDAAVFARCDLTLNQVMP